MEKSLRGAEGRRGSCGWGQVSQHASAVFEPRQATSAQPRRELLTGNQTTIHPSWIGSEFRPEERRREGNAEGGKDPFGGREAVEPSGGQSLNLLMKTHTLPGFLALIRSVKHGVLLL